MFGALIVGYLFCGGVGAGACCALSVMGLFVPRDQVACALVSKGRSNRRWRSEGFRSPGVYRRLFAPAFAAAAFLLIAGGILLACDAGTPAALLLLLQNPTPTYLSFGTYALVVLIFEAGLLALSWGLPALRLPYRIWQVFNGMALVLGLAVATYTGLQLASMRAVPLWSTQWLPVLFTVSSLSCGCALVMACACLSGSMGVFRTVMGRIARVDSVLLVVEALAAAAFIVAAFANPYDTAGTGAQALLVGELAVPFLCGFAGLGVVVPFSAEVVSTARDTFSENLLLAVSAGVLVGGLTMRYCIVMAGAHPEVWAVIS